MAMLDEKPSDLPDLILACTGGRENSGPGVPSWQRATGSQQPCSPVRSKGQVQFDGYLSRSVRRCRRKT